MSSWFSDESPPPRSLRVLTALALLGLMAIYVVDALTWASQSAVWLHTDGHIHYHRTVIAYEIFALGQGSFSGNLIFLCTYGPLYYLVGAAFMAVMGVNWGATVAATAAFGILGIWGAFLVGRRLGGRLGGLIAAALLMSLPLFRIHTFDTQLDFPGSCLCLFWVGAIGASDGFRHRGWSLAAGVGMAAILLMRWPLIPGVALAAALALVLALRGLGGGLKAVARGLGIALALTAPPLLLFLFAPEGVLEGEGVFLLGPVFLGAAVLSLWRWRGVGGNLLGALLLAEALLVPWYVRTRSMVWESIAHQGSEEMLSPDRYASPAYEGLLGKGAVVLNTLWAFEWGPALTLIGLVGIPLSLILGSPRARAAAAVALAFAFGMDAGIIYLKPPLVERWLFPGAVVALPLAVAPFLGLSGRIGGWLARRTGALAVGAGRGAGALLGGMLFAPLVGISWVAAYGWHAPGNPFAVSPKAWRKDIHVYNEPFEVPDRLAFRYHPEMLTTLMPLKDGYGWKAPPAFREAYGGSHITVAFYMDDHLRGDFNPLETLSNVERTFAAEGWPLIAEDPRDRVGASWRYYDAWAVVEGPASQLLARFAQLVGDEEPLMIAPFAEIAGNRVLLIWRPEGPLKRSPDERFAGTTLLQQGYGSQEGRPLPLPPLERAEETPSP